MKIKLCIALLAILSVTACARDGFEEEVPESSQESQSQSIVEDVTSSEEEPAEKITKVDSIQKEITSENMSIFYTVPETAPFAEDIEIIIEEVSSAYDMNISGASLELVDSITLNNGEVFSLFYEGVYKNDEIPDGREILFGLSFDVNTGLQIPISTWMESQVLATLLTDEQSSEIDASDEDTIAIREEIYNMGKDNRLANMINAVNEQNNIDQLLTFSYSLKEDEILFLLPLSGEVEDYAKITMPFQV